MSEADVERSAATYPAGSDVELATAPGRLDEEGARRALVGSAAMTALALVVLGALVDAGKLTSIDRLGFQHLAPFRAEPGHRAPELFAKLLAYHLDEFHPGGLVRIPASALPSLALVALLCFLLWRRPARVEAISS